MKTSGRLTTLAAAALVALGVPARGDEKSSTAVLRDKGLSKDGLIWILATEEDISKRLDDFSKLKKAVQEAESQREAFDRQIAVNKQTINNLFVERMRLNRQLGLASTVDDQNVLITRINQITDQINILSRTTAEAEKNDPARAALGQAKDAYLNELLELRRLVKETTDRYAALAADDAVKAALADLNAERKADLRLGPRPAFEKDVKRLEKLEKGIQSETIELKRHGTSFLVDVSINGSKRTTMAFDTGAEFVSIPHDLAAKIGLKPGDNDPTVVLQVADGRTVEAKQMTLKSVQVGNTKAEDVECVVMPPSEKDQMPLLGGTFLRHFVYKINPEAGTLVLTRIDVSDDGAHPAKSKTKK